MSNKDNRVIDGIVTFLWACIIAAIPIICIAKLLTYLYK